MWLIRSDVGDARSVSAVYRAAASRIIFCEYETENWKLKFLEKISPRSDQFKAELDLTRQGKAN